MYKWMVVFCLCTVALVAGEQRTWRDRKGNSMVGEFYRFDGDCVLLKRSGTNKYKRVKIMILVPEDRAYLAKIQSDRGYEETKRSEHAKTSNSGSETSVTLFSKTKDMSEAMIYAIIGGVVVFNILLVLGLGKLVFGGWRGFGQCLMFWFQPDWISAFRGEFAEDFFSSLKIVFFIILMCAAVIGEFIAAGMLLG